ncbi:MAG: 7-cyano-7-deazaguanine synthase [Deltaproteobacteria bacterium]|nr:7-cyano-7-deazaguanine synthase [Deltaproteobacteria bacterium]
MNAPSPVTVTSLSGGLDSTVLLARLLAKHGREAVRPVFFRYPSKHNAWEESAAEKVAAYYAVSLTVFDLTLPFSHMRSGLLLSDERPIPRAEYDAATMATTVVPGRNLIFASFMAAFAESIGAGEIALAVHSGDHHLYPDCRPAFTEALATVVARGTDGSVKVATPFVHKTKAELVAEGLALRAPLHLTRSCYANREKSCGVCGTCAERLAAFAANGVTDPVPYDPPGPEK